jgi:hypothetical protein
LKGLLVIRIGKRDCAVANGHDGQQECRVTRTLVEILPTSTQGRLGRVGVEMRSENRIQRLEQSERHGHHTKDTVLVAVESLGLKDVKVLEGNTLRTAKREGERKS